MKRSTISSVVLDESMIGLIVSWVLGVWFIFARECIYGGGMLTQDVFASLGVGSRVSIFDGAGKFLSCAQVAKVVPPGRDEESGHGYGQIWLSLAEERFRASTSMILRYVHHHSALYPGWYRPFCGLSPEESAQQQDPRWRKEDCILPYAIRVG